jgi:aspartyl-tRNA(Asn)/glutamyl-tRNA(Gln) amidotransferase subunit C
MNVKDVENLAELAKIDLNEEEKTKILKDMEGILDYVKVIEGVEVKEEDSPEYKLKNVWREDMTRKEPVFFSEDLIVKQFPDSQDGFLKVKKIL